jgi:glycerophosphoryl diester phosphodiesterase
MVKVLRTTVGGVSVLAHRGGSGLWRENTLEAFAGALANGADGVELDARVTADGEVVVHHDSETEAGDKIQELIRRDLPSYIPDLEAAVGACGPMLIDVEIKLESPAPGRRPDSGRCRAVAMGVAETVARRGSVFVSSFWPDALVVMGEVAPGIPTGLLVHPALDAEGAVSAAQNLGCSVFHPHVSAVTPGLVEHCRETGLEVGTWTANAPAEVTAVLRAGVDAVITDEVGLVRGLVSREQSAS